MEPPQATLYLKDVLELRLSAAVAPSATLAHCLVRSPGSAKFVELKKTEGRLRIPADCDCGVRVDAVDANDAGNWTLSAEYDAASFTAEATVNIRGEQTDTPLLAVKGLLQQLLASPV